MFTAAMIICSTLNTSDCQGMSSQSIYSTEEACMASRVNAEEFFKQRNHTVVVYKCINWGESA